MNVMRTITQQLTALVELALLSTPLLLYGQSTNNEAMEWFQKGVGEQRYEAKIEAYKKAVALDPQFIEALYNLGMTYKSRADYPLAERYLGQARDNLTERSNEKIKLQVTYELATTYKRLNRLKQAEKMLREAKTLAGSKDVSTNISLELGKVLFEQRRFTDIVREFQGERGHPPAVQMRFTKLVRAAQEEIDLERLYLTAVRYQEKGDLDAARTLFEQLQSRRPEYRDVETKIDGLLAQSDSKVKQKTAESLDSLYRQAQNYDRQGAFDKAITAYEGLNERSPGYKDSEEKLRAVKRKARQMQQREILAEQYAMALEAIREENWSTAIVVLNGISETDPNFRNVKAKLKQAKEKLEAEGTAQAAEPHYQDGMVALQNGRLDEAFASFEKVRAIDSAYKNVGKRIREIDEQIQANITAELDSMYQLAVVHMSGEDWLAAVTTLDAIQLRAPNYRDVDARLSLSRQHLTTDAAQDQNQQSAGTSKWHYYARAVTAMTALPLVAAIAVLSFSPVTRARLYAYRGNHARAALIYEKILERKPHKIALLVPLSNLYLQMQREDARALSLYRTVQKLNLKSANHDKINAIIESASEDNKSDALTILERELRSKSPGTG